MGKFFSCPSSKPVYSAEPAREAIELKETGSQSEERRFGEPIAYELRKAAQESYKTYLADLGEKVASRLEKCECPKEDISQFQIRGKLGRGSFGIVVVAKYLKDGEDYAIKIQRKKAIERDRRINDAIREKNLQWAAANDFVVALRFTFKDKANIYMMLEYSPYGDFARCVLCNPRWTSSEENVKLYAAQIVIGLEFLHRSDIILRDLKPENCIVFPDGYLKLNDFGLAKASKNETYTSCGTLAYMAPELVLKKGHRTAVDWWAFGVMVFELLHGKLPFYVSRKETLTKKNITSGAFEFDQSLELSSDVRCLIEQLLQISPAMRLGNLFDKADDIKLHPWFASISFQDVYKKKYKIELVCGPLDPEEADDMAVFGEGRTDDPYAVAFEDF